MALDGKCAIVTGAASGLGLAMSEVLAEAGARVVLIDIDDAGLEAARARIGDSAEVVRADAGSRASLRTAFSDVIQRHGRLDVCIANAGITAGPGYTTDAGQIGAVDDDQWDRVLDVNLTGAFLTVRPALKGMADRGKGRVIFVASVAGLRGAAYVAPYVASKHGVIGLTRALAAELLKKGVTVNAICPGYVETEMLEESIRRVMEKTGRSEAEARQGFAEINPNHRLVQPEEVAAAALWLVSDAAISVTGEAIPLSGGA